jgi:hypothetical protein
MLTNISIRRYGQLQVHWIDQLCVGEFCWIMARFLTTQQACHEHQTGRLLLGHSAVHHIRNINHDHARYRRHSGHCRYWYVPSVCPMQYSVTLTSTGTTLLLLPTDAYKRYMQATEAVVDSRTGLLKISKAKYANLKSLFFHINGVRISLS